MCQVISRIRTVHAHKLYVAVIDIPRMGGGGREEGRGSMNEIQAKSVVPCWLMLMAIPGPRALR